MIRENKQAAVGKGCWLRMNRERRFIPFLGVAILYGARRCNCILDLLRCHQPVSLSGRGKEFDDGLANHTFHKAPYIDFEGVGCINKLEK